MTTLASTIAFDLAARFAGALDLQTQSAPASLRRTYTWQDGAIANKANRIWTDRRTLGASATENLDLAGSLVDAFGVTITFARIRAIVVAAADANTNNVLVGGDATSTFLTWVGSEASQVVVRPGGLFALVAPDATAYAVTATTGDLLMLTNSAGTSGVTFDIALIGSAT
jgi:hypothetical protein